MAGMLCHIPIHGLTTHVHEQPAVIHVQSRELLTILSSSFFGGGFRRARHILNARVASDYCSNSPAADLRTMAARCGVSEPFVGLLTAVPLGKARIAFLTDERLAVAALVTAGVSNATCGGITPPCVIRPGTINIILMLDGKPTRAAMVNAIITATEAKCAVLGEMGIRTPDGALATGTSTDTITVAMTVAMTGRGRAQPYAGPATTLGWMIAKTVRQAVRESLLAA